MRREAAKVKRSIMVGHTNTAETIDAGYLRKVCLQFQAHFITCKAPENGEPRGNITTSKKVSKMEEKF